MSAFGVVESAIYVERRNLIFGGFINTGVITYMLWVLQGFLLQYLRV
jgi:hypothetical protein